MPIQRAARPFFCAHFPPRLIPIFTPPILARSLLPRYPSLQLSARSNPSRPGRFHRCQPRANFPHSCPMSILSPIPTPTTPAAHSAAQTPVLARPLADAIELTKPRITKMVLLTTGVGFTLAAIGRTWALGELIATILFCTVGAGLSAAGASALNQWMERDRDARMPRTASRPLPTHRLSARAGFLVGALCSIIGVLTLFLFVNSAAAAVSAATIFTYLLFYTPLKPVTPLATLVGAIPGALPPLIGWAAAARPWTDSMNAHSAGWRSLAEPGGWSLFLIMFMWQVPHFLAIAWWRRDQYALGGYKVLPIVDPAGARTSFTTLIWAIALVPASLAPVQMMPHLLGWLYATVAIAAGVMFVIVCVRFTQTRATKDAKRIFFASIIYLPVILLGMIADAALHTLRLW